MKSDNEFISVNGYILNLGNSLIKKKKLPDNTLLIKIQNSAEARNWVETNYSSGTFSYIKKSDTLYYITNTSTDWSNMFNNASSFHAGSSTYLLKVLDAGDTSYVTNMTYMFSGCTSLTSVPLFDTSNVTVMERMFISCKALTSVPLFDTRNVTTMYMMFKNCTSLTSVPLLDVSNVTDMFQMCYNCTKVESGALALYQRVSSTGKVTVYGDCFTNCGSDTETGRAELAQIPTSWGGTLT